MTAAYGGSTATIARGIAELAKRPLPTRRIGVPGASAGRCRPPTPAWCRRRRRWSRRTRVVTLLSLRWAGHAVATQPGPGSLPAGAPCPRHNRRAFAAQPGLQLARHRQVCRRCPPSGPRRPVQPISTPLPQVRRELPGRWVRRTRAFILTRAVTGATSEARGIDAGDSPGGQSAGGGRRPGGGSPVRYQPPAVRCDGRTRYHLLPQGTGPRPGERPGHRGERGNWLFPGPLLRPSAHTIRHCLSAARLNPRHPVETVLTCELWRRLHQPRATVSHYRRRGDPLPDRLRAWAHHRPIPPITDPQDLRL